MEIREFAFQLINTPSLEAKLRRCEGDLSDDEPGPPFKVSEPARPDNLQFAPRRAAPPMPKPGGLIDPRRRGIAHHILANHELQAVEVMAFVLLAFPDAPAEFRSGLIAIIDDEQRHTRMHADRAAELGVPFGSQPVNCYIWQKAQAFESVLDYLCGLPLVFENRNLDHTVEFEQYFLNAGDERSAGIVRAIHRDEIEHVRFGIEWLRRLKPAHESDWDTFRNHLKWPLRPEKARGDDFQTDARIAAGLSPEFVDLLRDSVNNSMSNDDRRTSS